MSGSEDESGGEEVEVEVNAPSAKNIYTFNDIQIRFPYTAYDSQLQMMEKIIEGVTTGQNCLLESPTGTGKTAALLCALLAWQRDSYDRSDFGETIIRTALKNLNGCNCSLRGDLAWTEGHFVYDSGRAMIRVQSISTRTTEGILGDIGINGPQVGGNDVTADDREILLQNACAYCTKKFVRRRYRPPKIYYCTRTHSQIAQVVNQLKNTPYRNTKMTILSSRDQSCISDRARKKVLQQNKGAEPGEKITINDRCLELKKNYFKMKKGGDPGPTCPYFAENHELATNFYPLLTQGAWDIEDIRADGEGIGKCPYYGSRSLQTEADIVFGSYNYLIYPHLRSIMNIQFINSVVVFDEAHNIEDICRDAFSLRIDLEHFDKNIRPLVDKLSERIETEADISETVIFALKKISVILEGWSNWIKIKGNEMSPARPGLGGDQHLQYEPDQLVDTLIEIGLTESSIMTCLDFLGKGEVGEVDIWEGQEYTDRHGQKRPVRVSSRVSEFLQDLYEKVKQIFRGEGDEVGGNQDFKGFLTKSWNPSSGHEKLSFSIICLNPAVAFRKLKESCFSIIVASGTLTPLESFSGELGTPFGISLQANHVIPPENVYATVVANGPAPNETLLRLVKQNQDDPVIQDDIGKIVAEICETVPNGILVFLPSYSLMRNLLGRWERTSLMQRIGRRKHIFQEQSSNRREFKETMEKFKAEVTGGPGWDGCVLFAVLRGKVSEGVDFADEQARAVITIGVPFSNLGAPDIRAKRAYNQRRSQTESDILPGWEWYTTQAYRALNQGLGRCVRHVNDWGALILVDSRIMEPDHQQHLSAWVRDRIVDHGDTQFTTVKEGLRDFIRQMRGRGRDRPAVEYEVLNDDHDDGAEDEPELAEEERYDEEPI